MRNEIACAKTNKTCTEKGQQQFELQRTLNIPDWETCSILCWGKSELENLCWDWEFSVTGKLCILYRTCTRQPRDDENNIVGNRNCHATRK